MLDDVVAAIRERLSRYDEQMEPACDDRQLERLRDRARQVLGQEMPLEYCDLLRAVNGFEYDGLKVYSASGRAIGQDIPGVLDIIEMNLTYRADLPGFSNYIAFADDDLCKYVLDLRTGNYLMLTHSDDVVRKFASFEDMLRTAIAPHL